MMSLNEKDKMICFQDLWKVVSDQSHCSSTLQHVKETLTTITSSTSFYKQQSKTSQSALEKKSNASKDLVCIAKRFAKLCNLDSLQAFQLIEQYQSCFFNGSQEKLSEMAAEEKCIPALLQGLITHYYTERLFLMRVISTIITNFQNTKHCLRDLFSEILHSCPDLMSSLQSQLESLMKEKAPSIHTRGDDCTPNVVTTLSAYQLMEQNELLKIFSLYYSLFEMPCEVLLKFANAFKDYGFGYSHPLRQIVPNHLSQHLLACMNTLMQIIIIEGFDMDFLQESDACKEHQLVKNTKVQDSLDKTILSLSNEVELSPLLLSWAVVRYILMKDNGGEKTQMLGEKAIEFRVWTHMRTAIEMYPFNTETEIGPISRKVFRSVLTCVTQIFHESTLGEFTELVQVATLLLGNKRNHAIQGKGIAGCSLDLLLMSSAGYFPINMELMLSLLIKMADTASSAIQIHAFVSSLPSFAEYLSTCTRDEVESVDDGSCWRLVANKPIRSVGYQMKIPYGTYGHLMESQFGKMVQWQFEVNGWQIFEAELKALTEYSSSSTSLEVFGIDSKALFILKLVERTLVALASNQDTEDTGCMAVLETMEPFIHHCFKIISRASHAALPSCDLIAACVRCITAWLQTNPASNYQIITSLLGQMNFLPSPNVVDIDMYPTSYNAEEKSPNPGLYGKLLTECERMSGTYHVSVATINLVKTIVESSSQDQPLPPYTVASCEFILREVFSLFGDWLRNDPESWENIGIACLELSQSILSMKDTSSSIQRLRHKLIEIFTKTEACDVLIKAASVNADDLEARLTTEPASLQTQRMESSIKYSFRILDSLLKDMPGCRDKTDSYLQKKLSATTIGENSLVFILAGYVRHRLSNEFPLLALSLLKNISNIVPMSLHALLRNDAASFRDICTYRLKSKEEEPGMKIAVVELLIVAMETQPALFQLFLDLKQNNDKDTSTAKRITLGKSSCLQVIVDFMKPTSQKGNPLPVDLHITCVKLLNALWAERTIPVIQALKDGVGELFWSSLMLPLFSENSPKDLAPHKVLEVCAHIINIIALEKFYASGQDKAFTTLMKEFDVKKRSSHWSKVFLCVCNSICVVKVEERNRLLMFASAWKSFLLTGLVKDKDVVKLAVDDLITAVEFLCTQDTSISDVTTLLNLASSTLVVMINKVTLTDVKPFATLVSCLDSIKETSSSFESYHTSLYAICLSLMKKSSKKCIEEHSSSLKILIQITCANLQSVFNGQSAPYSSFTVQISVLFLRTLMSCFSLNDDAIKRTWITCVSRESTLVMLMAVLVDLLSFPTSSHNVQLCEVIMWLLVQTAGNCETAMMIRHSTKLTDLFLSLTACYNSASSATAAGKGSNNPLLDVYLASIVFVQQMVKTLSYDFLCCALDYIGVHQSRFLECFGELSVNHKTAAITASTVEELSLTTSVLLLMVTQFPHEYKFNLRSFFERSTENIAVLTHTCVALVLHPHHLSETMKMKISKEKSSSNVKSTTSSSHVISACHTLPTLSRQTSSTRTNSVSEDDNFPPKVQAVLRGLYSILSNCVSYLRSISPDLSQLVLDSGLDIDEFPTLLQLNFATPTLSHDSLPTFGTIMNAATSTLQKAHKVDTNEDDGKHFHDLLVYISDQSLALAMSQCLLILKHPEVSPKHKHMLKRELGDEMSSCVRVELRHLRHSSSSQDTTASNEKLSSSSKRGIIHLLDVFVKQVMR